jgi:6,7-dimethyl-8-ribityllumazine synthase
VSGKGASSGPSDARGLRVILLRSRFNAVVVDGLVAGAQGALRAMGARAADVMTVDVPGAFELPVAAAAAAGTRRYACLVALGAVIRGDTPHFEYVAGACASGISRIALDTGVPIAFGVLTTDDREQAFARTGGAEGNKGAEAAATAVEMVDLLRQLGKGGG